MRGGCERRDIDRFPMLLEMIPIHPYAFYDEFLSPSFKVFSRDSIL